MMNVFQDIYDIYHHLSTFILIRVGESAFWILLNEHMCVFFLTQDVLPSEELALRYNDKSPLEKLGQNPTSFHFFLLFWRSPTSLMPQQISPVYDDISFTRMQTLCDPIRFSFSQSYLIPVDCPVAQMFLP